MLTYREWRDKEERRRRMLRVALACFAGCAVIALVAWAVR